MNRNKIHYIFGQNIPKTSEENIVFHEAGHAAAIYLNNKTRNLPPVFFQIMLKNNSLKDSKKEQEEDLSFARPVDAEGIAKIEGGRLIQLFLPLHQVTDDYLAAFEADIINLLSGPLAEAKYIHQCDNEIFSERLVNIDALNNYGGQLDLALVSDYLQSLYPAKQEQNEKLQQLFITAFDFVDSNWKAITLLANYICESNKNIIDLVEVESILESMEER